MRRAIALAALGLSGCVPWTLGKVSYSLPLMSVERPVGVTQRWGEYRIDQADSLTGYRYQDGLVRILALAENGVFFLEIENRSEQSIQVVWDQAAYVGPDGVTSKVTNGDTRVIDMEKSQTPTVIPRAARAQLTAIPNRNYTTGVVGYSPDRVEDFVPLVDEAPAYNGKEVRLLIPLSVQDVVNEYTMVFRIVGVRVPWTEPGCTAARYRQRQCKE